MALKRIFTKQTRKCLAISLLMLLVSFSICAFLSSTNAGQKKVHYIFSVARNDNASIVEWINHHLWLGFEKFVIYNQDDDHSILEDKLLGYVADGKVSLQRAPPGEQKSCYIDAIQKFAEKASTMTFLDIDEFIVLCEHLRIDDAYADLLQKPSFSKDCAGLSWLVFGTSYLKSHDPANGVLNHLLRREKTHFKEHSGKVVLRGGAWSKHAVKQAAKNIHPFWHHCGVWAGPGKITHFDSNSVRINHYSLKHGEESFSHRIKRGSKGDFAGQKM